MFEKLKNNYALSSWLARGAYVLLYVFAMWRVSQSFLTAYGEQLAIVPTIWTALLVSLLAGIIALIFIPFFTGFILNFLRFFFLPRQEFALIVVIFLAIKNLILGALNCLYFITPVIMAWGQIAFPVLAFLISGILFFITVKKCYLNNKTSLHFFKTLVIFFCVLSVLSVIQGIVIFGV